MVMLSLLNNLGKGGLRFSVCELNINSLTTAVTLQGIFTSGPDSFALRISRPTCKSVTTTYPTEQIDLCQLFDL